MVGLQRLMVGPVPQCSYATVGTYVHLPLLHACLCRSGMTVVTVGSVLTVMI